MDSADLDEIEAEAESFLTGNEKIQEKIKSLFKHFSTQEDPLLVDDLDDEQIFQQIDFIFSQKEPLGINYIL